MKFIIQYTGRLRAVSQSNSRRKNKHDIRKRFHPQLAKLWRTRLSAAKDMEEGDEKDKRQEEYFAHYSTSRTDFRFVPVVSRREHYVCDLDITFLRREKPGSIIRSGGDLDNRIKCLFDALRVPSDDEIKELSPSPNEDPFFCLVEDDALITGFRVSSRELLDDAGSPEEEKDIQLLIEVEMLRTEGTGYGVGDLPNV